MGVSHKVGFQTQMKRGSNRWRKGEVKGPEAGGNLACLCYSTEATVVDEAEKAKERVLGNKLKKWRKPELSK